MKCFVRGFVGVIAGVVLFAIGYSQYSDYTVEAQLHVWCIELEEKAGEIVQLAQKERRLVDVSRKVSPYTFSVSSGVRNHKILDSGAIFVQGGIVDQILLLVPVFVDPEVNWEAYVGPAKLTPSNCRNLTPRINEK